MFKVAHSESLFHILIGINGSDTSSRRTELFVFQSVFFESVKKFIVRHAYRRLVAYLKVLGGNLYTCVAQSFDFAVKVFEVDDHTVAHNVDGVVAQNTRRKKVKYEFTLFVYYRVSGVVAALITCDDVVLVGQKVYHSALTFVAPVDTDYCSKHLFISPILFFFIL